MHKANKKKKQHFSTQEEIDWGAVPSRLCNEMRSEEGRPIVKASGGGWKGVEDGEERRRVNKRKQKKKTMKKVRRKRGREKRRQFQIQFVKNIHYKTDILCIYKHIKLTSLQLA